MEIIRSLPFPVLLEIGQAVNAELQEVQEDQNSVDVMLVEMRQKLYCELGVCFPNVPLCTNYKILEPNEYLIYLNEIPFIKGQIQRTYLLTSESEETLKKHNLPFIFCQNTLGMPSFWVQEEYEEILNQIGIKFWSPLEAIILHLSYFFRQNAQKFIGLQEMENILEFARQSFPALVTAVTQLLSLQNLTAIFKRLLAEQISIRDLRTIFETLSEWALLEKNTNFLTEYVRSSLKRYICHKYSQGQPTLSAYILDPEIENIIRDAIKKTSTDSYMDLDFNAAKLILQSVREVVAPTSYSNPSAVILTAIDTRRFFQELIKLEFMDIFVISYQEINPETSIQPLGKIKLS
jgi:type III secretion protein V